MVGCVRECLILQKNHPKNSRWRLQDFYDLVWEVTSMHFIAQNVSLRDTPDSGKVTHEDTHTRSMVYYESVSGIARS